VQAGRSQAWCKWKGKERTKWRASFCAPRRVCSLRSNNRWLGALQERFLGHGGRRVGRGRPRDGSRAHRQISSPASSTRTASGWTAPRRCACAPTLARAGRPRGFRQGLAGAGSAAQPLMRTCPQRPVRLVACQGRALRALAGPAGRAARRAGAAAAAGGARRGPGERRRRGVGTGL